MIRAAFILFIVFIKELLLSNWAMMTTVFLFKKNRPAIIKFELRIKNPKSVALISNMITLTPGTVTLDYNEAENSLLIYAFNGEDPEAVIAGVRANFENYLIEIWG